MSPTSIPMVLRPLVRYLDSLKGRASLDELRTLLRSSRVSLHDIGPWVQFDSSRYRRNRIAGSSWYDLVAICWKSGQRSPIHDHADSSCAFKVLTGVCSETAYDFAPCGQVFPLRTVDQLEGSIVATQDDDTHQVSNLQPEGRDLVTLHIYSPPLKSMHTFSLLGEASRSWRASDHVQDAGNCYGESI